MKKIAAFRCVGVGLVVLGLGGLVQAQTAGQAWLKYDLAGRAHAERPIAVRALGTDVLEQSAVEELKRDAGPLAGQEAVGTGVTARAGTGLAGQIVVGTVAEMRAAFPKIAIPDLGRDAYWIDAKHGSEGVKQLVLIAGGDARGALYGTFAFLRSAAEGKASRDADERSSPAMPVRWVDEWDNADGSIERGYAGRSIFFEGGKVREDLAPVGEYARLLASVGIDGCNVNNVNNAAPFLDPAMLKGLASVADAMRPWGVRLALSVDVASPQKIGGLATYDPLDPQVKAWWKAKVEEIYTLIPDFAGFTVKADSEGQPGPASYGRTPADAANTLAGALAPHGGVVLYRAFVYNHHLDWNDKKADRARAAYDIFQPLDGKFAPNVIVQIKEGPIDFQVREPVSPLFGGLPQTGKAMEVQITQEYLGQQRHMVYLGSKWEWVLREERQLAQAADEATSGGGKKAGTAKGLTGLIGVACVGRDGWLGSPLALANLYAFGRLAWDPGLQAGVIAEEWTRQTISSDPAVVHTVVDMLTESWRAYERYTGPLGLQTLTDVTGSHYGPNIEASENNGWGQWHRADHEGVGMDRTVATGTGFVGQYPAEIARLYENPESTVSGLLLFFHHLPYTFRLHDGKTIIQAIYDKHYLGAEEAAGFVKDWKSLDGKIDPALYNDVLPRLEYQAGHASVWRDAVVQYFLKLSGIPDEKGRAGNFPGRIEAEDAQLSGYQVIDVKPWEDASRGKAIWCPAGTARSCTAEWTYRGATGVFDLAVEYFDLQDGVAKFSVTMNGKAASRDAAWDADALLPSRRPHGDNSIRHVVHGVELKDGNVIRVTGTPDGRDGAALDYVEVTRSEDRD